MRISLHSGLFLLFSAAMLLSGCSKDKDDNAATSNTGGGLISGGDNGGGNNGGDNQTAVQLLCDKNYKLTAASISPAYMGSTDYFAMLPTCSTDDIFRFAQNGTVTIDEGAEKCDASDPQVSNGTWALTQNNTVLTLTMDGQAVTFTVVTLNGTILKLSWQEQDQGGQTYTITGTWTKQ